MIKYRLLTPEELELFEKEFIDYLVVNSITADDWIKIKTTDNAMAKRILSLFSDVVLEKVLRQAQYLKKVNHDSIMCFHFQSQQIVMVGIQASDKQEIDCYLNGKNTDISKLQLLSSTKKYTRQSELEMFDMIEKGAVISDGSLYKKLWLLATENAT